MRAEFPVDLHPLRPSRWLPDLVSRLRCPGCHDGHLSLYSDDSIPLEQSSTAVIVCEGCHTCFVYADGILNLLPERPEHLTPAQKSNFNPLVASFYRIAWRSWSMRLLTGDRLTNTEEARWIADRALHDTAPAELAAVDLGTSHGLYAIGMAVLMRERKVEGYVAAVDFSPRMIRQAISEAEREGVADRIVWLLADAENLPFKNTSIPCLTDGGTLNEYSDEKRVLDECSRVLQKPGRLIAMHLFSESGMVGSIMRFVGKISGLRFPSQSGWADRFKNADFLMRKQERKGRVLFSELTVGRD